MAWFENAADPSSSYTDNPRGSVQCVDDPDGQHGHVVTDNLSYSLPCPNTDPDKEGLLSDFAEDEGLMLDERHRSSMHYETYGDVTAVQYHAENNSADHPETRNTVNPSSTDTDNPLVSVQCEDDPEGQRGCVVMDNISYRLPWLNTDEGISPDFLEEEDLIVDDSHQSFTHYERHGDSTAVQAQSSNSSKDLEKSLISVDVFQHHNEHNSMNHPETRDAVDPSSTDTDHPRVSVQCEDDPEGQHGLIVFDHISYGLLRLNGDTDDVGISADIVQVDVLMLDDSHQSCIMLAYLDLF